MLKTSRSLMKSVVKLLRGFVRYGSYFLESCRCSREGQTEAIEKAKAESAQKIKYMEIFS